MAMLTYRQEPAYLCTSSNAQRASLILMVEHHILSSLEALRLDWRPGCRGDGGGESCRADMAGSGSSVKLRL